MMPEVIIDGQVYIQQPLIAQDACACEKALNAFIKRSNDFDDNTITVRDYLFKLLKTLWMEGEGFSGKRPFGNGGWSYDLIDSLIICGYIPGEIDEDNIYSGKYDTDEANKLVLELIAFAFYGTVKQQ
jgi:hypothetical protein